MKFLRNKFSQKGYVLPATIVLGFAIAILSVSLLQTTSTSTQNLNNASYQASAQEAANAGLKAASYCVQNNIQFWSTLTPATGCNGSPLSAGAKDTLVKQGNDWKSSYTVYQPKVVNGLLTALSVGTVKLLASDGVTVVSTFTAKSKITLPSTPTIQKRATGNVITDIKNDITNCAIANGQLYCWGDNSTGQLGRGYTGNTPPASSPSRGTPTVVGGALAGKTVTRVSVAYASVCAIADGLPYCWGDNASYQLGNGSNAATNIPQADIPKVSTGPLSGQTVIDIGTASANNPANIVWPFATAFPHSCALTSNGVVSCWGDGGFRQNTGGGGFIYYSYPSPQTPALVMGYSDNSAPLAGNKTERIGASSHDTCALTEGRMICWGVPAPLPGICYIPPTGQFSNAYQTIIPFNQCVASYSNGYDTSTISGSALAGKFIDPASWNLSSNETCLMANTDMVCFGETPAFNALWFDAWGAPFTVLTNADVTDADNGDAALSAGTRGIFCIVNKGEGMCSANPGNTTASGTGTSGYKNFQPLIKTTGLTGKTATKIAAGQDHGCVVANGQLLCWGDGTNGVFGDGNTASHSSTSAKLTAGSSIGTDDGTYAAHASIASGTNFSCSIINGKVFCWGDNNKGKLGLGTASLGTPNTREHPQRLSDLLPYTATKVSAGKDHACAIASGQLYCWGDNSSGQLGLGNSATVSQNPSPQLVNGNGALTTSMRVTDVSAGDKNTCAVANGQLYCWGDDTNGQLGSGNALRTARKTDSPVLMSNKGALNTGLNATAVSVGKNHICAIANSDAYCWGDNQFGETGTSFAPSPTPITPTKLTLGTAGSPTGPNGTTPMVSAISAGSDFSCGVFNTKISCWGSNANGRTGQNTTTGYTVTPTQIAGTARNYYATSISLGDSHACAILNGNQSYTNGNLFCWGASANGRLGYAPQPLTDISSVNTPINPLSGGTNNVAGNDSVGRSTTAVSAGNDSTCSISNGDILCWGDGSSGQIGNDSTASQILPTITSDYSIGVFTKPMIY